jgi:hypothetical protein
MNLILQFIYLYLCIFNKSQKIFILVRKIKKCIFIKLRSVFCVYIYKCVNLYVFNLKCSMLGRYETPQIWFFKPLVDKNMRCFFRKSGFGRRLVVLNREKIFEFVSKFKILLFNNLIKAIDSQQHCIERAVLHLKTIFFLHM